MTKDEILEKARIEMPFHFPERIKPYIEESMDIYAKQDAIAFKEWQDENLDGKVWEQYSGHDEWYNGHTKQVISTEQLYDIFLSQKRK